MMTHESTKEVTTSIKEINFGMTIRILFVFFLSEQTLFDIAECPEWFLQDLLH